MQSSKIPGGDVEIIEVSNKLKAEIVEFFNRCIQKRKVSQEWYNMMIVLKILIRC